MVLFHNTNRKSTSCRLQIVPSRNKEGNRSKQSESFQPRHFIGIYRKSIPEKIKKFQDSAGIAEGPSRKQLSLSQAFERNKKLEICDSRAVSINRKILQMMAMDNQPFSLVEDKGFKELIAHLSPN